MHHDIPEEEESPIKRIVKRIVIGIIGLFLLLLMISYFTFGGFLQPILESYFISYPVENDMVFLQDGSRIVFAEGVYDELKEIWFSEQTHEFKACLLGEKKGAYYVTGIERPEIYSQSFGHVSSDWCGEETLITLHSHPKLWCRFSDQDIMSYKVFLGVNPDALLGLMCDTNRFNFYRYN